MGQWQWPRPASRNPADCGRTSSSGSPATAERSGHHRVPARPVDPLPGSGSRSSAIAAAQHQARLQALNADGQLRGQLLLGGAVHFFVLRRRRRRRARSGRERHPGGVPTAPQPKPAASAATKERRRPPEVSQFGRGHRNESRIVRPAAEHHPAAEHPQQGQVPSVV